MWSFVRWLVLLVGVATVGCSSPARPGPPSAVSVIAGDRQATVTWEAPLEGADGVLEYLVSAEPGSILLTVAASALPGEPLSARLPGLTNGVEYTFTVTAVSDAGSGEPATGAPATPAGLPGPPGLLAVRSVASGTILLTWERPEDDGGIPLERYEVASEPEGLFALVDAGATEVRLEGFERATEYRITVTARNRMGLGERADSPMITPLPNPVDISIVAADLDAGFLADEVAWVEPGSRLLPDVPIAVSTPFRLTSLVRPEIVFGATFLLRDDAEVVEFDASMLNVETLIALLGPDAEVSVQASIDETLLALPGPASGVSVVLVTDDGPARFDLVVARGGNVGTLVIVAELDGATPAIDVADVARRLVVQGIAAAPLEAVPPPSLPSMLWTGVARGTWISLRTIPGADPDSDAWTIDLFGATQVCASEARPDGWSLSDCSDTGGRLAIDLLVPRDPERALELSGRDFGGDSFSASLRRVEDLDEPSASPNVELVWRHDRSHLIGSYSDVWAEDGLVYAGNFGGLVEILDAENGALLSRASRPGDGAVLDVKARGRIMYAATTDGGLLIWDVSDAATPVLAGQYTRRGQGAASDNFFNVHNIALSPRGDIVYALNTSFPRGDLRLIDVSDPAQPVEVGRFGFVTDGVPANGVHDIDVVERDGRLIGYLNGLGSGLLILDLTEPSDIRLLGSIRWEGSFSHSGAVYGLGAAVYFAHTDEGPDQGLTIVDVTDASAPRVVSRFETREGISIHNLEVVEGIAYISYYIDGLRVVDLRDPEHPREIAHYDTVPREQERSILQGAWGVRVLDGRVFISDRTNGVFAFEVDTEAED